MDNVNSELANATWGVVYQCIDEPGSLELRQILHDLLIDYLPNDPKGDAVRSQLGLLLDPAGWWEVDRLMAGLCLKWTVNAETDARYVFKISSFRDGSCPARCDCDQTSYPLIASAATDWRWTCMTCVVHRGLVGRLREDQT